MIGYTARESAFTPKAVLYAASFLVLVQVFAGPLNVTMAAEETANAEEQGQSIVFSRDLRGTLELAVKSGKPVLLAFGAVWCPHCRNMKSKTLSAPEVRALANRFHWVQADIDRNLTLARSYNVRAVPQVVLLASNGKEMARMTGALGPAEFSAFLRDFLEDMEGKEVPEEPILAGKDGLSTPLVITPDGYRGKAICFSHVGYGPLRLQSQSPFQSLRLGLIPRTPSTLAKGEFEARIAETWVNIWAYEKNRYRLDYEMLQSVFSLGYGITDTLQIDVEIGDRSRFGGAMDGFIQGFHDMFGFDQEYRDEFSKGDLAIELAPLNGQPAVSLDKDNGGSFSQSIALTLQHNVTCGTPVFPAFSYALTGRFGDSEDLSGGDNFDLGASVALARRFRNTYAYISVGYAMFGRDDARGIDLRETQLSALGALEWQYAPRRALIVQYLMSEGVAEDWGPFSDPSHEVTVGWKREFEGNTVLEIGLIENMVTMDNSPDFGVHVALSRRF